MKKLNGFERFMLSAIVAIVLLIAWLAKIVSGQLEPFAGNLADPTAACHRLLKKVAYNSAKALWVAELNNRTVELACAVSVNEPEGEGQKRGPNRLRVFRQNDNAVEEIQYQTMALIDRAASAFLLADNHLWSTLEEACGVDGELLFATYFRASTPQESSSVSPATLYCLDRTRSEICVKWWNADVEQTQECRYRERGVIYAAGVSGFESPLSN